MKSELNISSSILALFQAERALLKRITSILFAIAGCSWFLLYLPESVINHEAHEVFKLQQYQIYVVLLTIWGLDYKRQLNRISAIALQASVLQKKFESIEASDIHHELQLFEVLMPIKKTKGKHIALIITWIFLGLSIILIIRQFMLLFAL